MPSPSLRAALVHKSSPKPTAAASRLCDPSHPPHFSFQLIPFSSANERLAIMTGASATPPLRLHDLPTSSVARSASSSQQGLTVESALSAYANAENPALSALEQSVSERILLSSQNTQLWKLIERSRGLYTESQRNLERVRMERDAYKAMLLKLGENPDAIARGHRAREKQLKSSPSSNGIRQGSEPHPSPSSGLARPTRHQSHDTGTHRLLYCIFPSSLLIS